MSNLYTNALMVSYDKRSSRRSGEKVCTACKKNKSITKSYHIKDPKTGARKSRCKQCLRAYNRRYYAKNREACRARARKKHQELTVNGGRIRDWLAKTYGEIPCTDCGGEFQWCAMDFDHLPEHKKEFTIGSYGWRELTPRVLVRVKEEIAKCELVCSNCHRIRTQERR